MVALVFIDMVQLSMLFPAERSQVQQCSRDLDRLEGLVSGKDLWVNGLFYFNIGFCVLDAPPPQLIGVNEVILRATCADLSIL